MNYYEHTLIARQDTSPSQIKQIQDKYSKIIESNDGNILKFESWGLMHLSYLIKKNKKGNYLHFKIEGNGDLIKELEKNEIDFKYIEKPSIKVLNELYNILDLYIVASRVEGGPQSILECSITKTPIISTDVGIASEILSPSSIYSYQEIGKASPDIEHAYKNVQQYLLPKGIENFDKMFK